jgi:hypothetical protein
MARTHAPARTNCAAPTEQTNPDDVVHDTTGYAVCLQCNVEYNLAPGDRYSLVHRCEPETDYSRG